MKKVFSKVLHSLEIQSTKSILTLASGAFFAQLITLIASPILSRLFSPEQIGQYTLILTVESLFSGVICGRYDVMVVQEPEEYNVGKLIQLSAYVSFVLSLLIAIIFSLFFSGKISFLPLWLVGCFLFIYLFFNGLSRLLEAYNNRKKEYTLMSSVYVQRTFFQNFFSCFFGIINFGILGLLISHAVGNFSGMYKQSKSLRKDREKWGKSSFKDLLFIAKKYKNQPFYSAPALLVNRFSYSSINIFVEMLFGINVLGLYSLSYRILGLPLSILSLNISKVFFREASAEYNKTGQFKQTLKKTTYPLLLMAIPLFLTLYFLVPPLISIIFGEKWINAGIYIQSLAFLFSLRFVVNTISYGLQIVGKQKVELIAQSLFVLAVVISYSVTKQLSYSMIGFLRLISITFILIYLLIYLLVAYYAVKGRK